MHHWLAIILSVISVVFGALLIYFVLIGITYFGVTTQQEMILAVISLVIAAIFAWIAYTGYSSSYSKVKTGREALIGARGVAVTDLKPKGEVRVMGEFWQATAKDKTIANGQAIEVLDLEGMFLVVKPADEKA